MNNGSLPRRLSLGGVSKEGVSGSLYSPCRSSDAAALPFVSARGSMYALASEVLLGLHSLSQADPYNLCGSRGFECGRRGLGFCQCESQGQLCDKRCRSPMVLLPQLRSRWQTRSLRPADKAHVFGNAAAGGKLHNATSARRSVETAVVQRLKA